jgi:hypothetical protein
MLASMHNACANVNAPQELWHQRTALDQLAAAAESDPSLAGASTMGLPQLVPELLRFEGVPAPAETGAPVTAEEELVRRQFAQLASRCMALDPDQRPSFDQVNAELDQMRAKMAGAEAT